jgi:PilZ domain
MEKRASLRHRVSSAGTIEFDGGAINCVVRNLSSTGARLDLASPVEIPDHFTLILLEEGHHTPCRTVWRKEKRMGVVFE